MPQAKNMPCHLCPTCENYEHKEHSSFPHRCHNSMVFDSNGKCGQNPDKEGTASNCKKYKPR